MNKHYIFVYGTLMNGQALNKMLVEGQYMHKAQTTGYALYARGIPYMVDDSTQPSWPTRPRTLPRVQGELWKVSDNTLALLDQLEGHPHAYKREEVRLHCAAANYAWRQRKVQAYIYQHEPPVGAVLVESGDFNDYKQKVAT